MICRSRSQLSHIRGIPMVPTLTTGQGNIVTARVYRVCCYVSVGRILAM